MHGGHGDDRRPGAHLQHDRVQAVGDHRRGAPRGPRQQVAVISMSSYTRHHVVVEVAQVLVQAGRRGRRPRGAPCRSGPRAAGATTRRKRTRSRRRAKARRGPGRPGAGRPAGPCPRCVACDARAPRSSRRRSSRGRRSARAVAAQRPHRRWPSGDVAGARPSARRPDATVTRKRRPTNSASSCRRRRRRGRGPSAGRVGDERRRSPRSGRAWAAGGPRAPPRRRAPAGRGALRAGRAPRAMASSHVDPEQHVRIGGGFAARLVDGATSAALPSRNGVSVMVTGRAFSATGRARPAAAAAAVYWRAPGRGAVW